MSDMLRLQNHINELNRKLWEKYCLLQYKKRTEPDAESLSQIRHLQNEVEALRGELTEKVRESQANMVKPLSFLQSEILLSTCYFVDLFPGLIIQRYKSMLIYFFLKV
jgi:hypothetical protein